MSKHNKNRHRANYPNPLIEKWVYGCRSRPPDLNLHPTEKPKPKKEAKAIDIKL